MSLGIQKQSSQVYSPTINNKIAQVDNKQDNTSQSESNPKEIKGNNEKSTATLTPAITGNSGISPKDSTVNFPTKIKPPVSGESSTANPEVSSNGGVGVAVTGKLKTDAAGVVKDKQVGVGVSYKNDQGTLEGQASVGVKGNAETGDTITYKASGSVGNTPQARKDAVEAANSAND